MTIKDLVKKNDIVVEYIGIDFMLVDPLTKGLKPIVFKNHVESMSIVSSFDVPELDVFGTTIPMVNVILETMYDYKLDVVRTTVPMVAAMLELRRYGL